ncbi:MAG: hypothetical protein H7336_11610 [Bacteriovorax sp.]|nr:hypothetical protein [Bacteriovorax sp.]
MKVLIGLSLVLLSFGGTVMASEFQSLSGDEAYQIYKTLPGKACQEYRLVNYVVFTKYQTKSCEENQTDASKWSCTVQFSVKNGKTSEVISADCSRQI